MGTRLFCYVIPGKGYDACKAVFNELAPLTPGTSETVSYTHLDVYKRQIQQRPGQAPDGKQPDGQEQHRRDNNAAEHLFLLLGHASSPPSADVPEWLPARVVFHR